MRVFNIIKQRSCFLLLIFTLVNFILISSQVQASMNNTNSSLEIFDNGTLTLKAEGVPLGTLLGKIQEKTNLEFKIHENLLRQPIFVSFQSLPLNKAIRRILQGVSYACVFDSNGNVEKIIALPYAGKDSDDQIARGEPRLSLPYERAMEITPPFELEDLMEAIENIPLPQVEDTNVAVETTPPSEAVKDFIEAIEDAGGTPPAELEELIEAMEEAAQLGPQISEDG